MKKIIKIYMCCHKGYDYVPRPAVPIQCGSALRPESSKVLSDIGERGDISAKNLWYCELTAHYYAWKNVAADYYGFCHYRRFFAYADNFKKPYIVCGKLTAAYERFLFGENELKKAVEEYDVIIPRCENMGLTTAEHYSVSSGHSEKDLKSFIDILSDISPRFSESAHEYLHQNSQYFCNMFIMEKKCFDEYCGVLFSALEEFDRKGTHAYRTNGYLGEIFTGIYITYLKKSGFRIKEILRLDTECGFKKRLLYKLFPPESRRRFALKKLIRRLGQ